MEKRNILLLTVIAIATLLVAIAGATFAYFAGTVNITNYTLVNATTPQSKSIFKSTGTEISLGVTADTMQKAESNSGTKTVATASGTLSVSYISGVTTQTKCSYNVYYQWVDGNTENKKYTISSVGENEFTYAISSTDDLLTVPETNFVASTTSTKQKLNSSKIEIANAAETEAGATVQTFTVTAKFYNLKDVNQSANAGKNWNVKFFVDDVVC